MDLSIPSSAPTASSASSPEPISTTPTSSAIPIMASASDAASDAASVSVSTAMAKRRRRRRVYRPDEGSLYDKMWEHAGVSLFVRPICWTDLHLRLLGATFVEMPRCDTPVPPQSPRGAPVSPSRCHLKPSAAATTLSRELTAMLADGVNRYYYSQSVRIVMSTLYPEKLSSDRMQPALHHYFGGMVYRDTCRVQVIWDSSQSRSGSIGSFESASTRPAESFGIPTGGGADCATSGSGSGSGSSSASGASQQTSPPASQPVLSYVGKAQIVATRRNMYRVIQGPNHSYNGPVERLQQLRSKMFVPANPNHDPLIVGIILALAQKRFYVEPVLAPTKWYPQRATPLGPGEPEFHDVTVHLLMNDNETCEFMVYKGKVTADLLLKFHEPTKNPRAAAGKTLAEKMEGLADEGGIRIEYTRVPVWPILGLKERLGKALGSDIVGDFDEDNIETWEEEADRKVDRLKRRREREALAEVFNGSFEEDAPDGMPLSGKRRCLVDEESGQVGVVV